MVNIVELGENAFWDNSLICSIIIKQFEPINWVHLDHFDQDFWKLKLI